MQPTMIMKKLKRSRTTSSERLLNIRFTTPEILLFERMILFTLFGVVFGSSFSSLPEQFIVFQKDFCLINVHLAFGIKIIAYNL